MEKQEVTELIAVDLSAAFDTVDHGIFTDVHNKQYGCTSTALGWIDTYLRPRPSKRKLSIVISTSTGM
ncbi:hypothetical protein DPMN_192717 [Dreissena polymorpha]|uniref:Reverse transcriptase domain-containing protein n=1 Tax=Dreissena polymorpha TaxID=45954 RepID=A0A9D3Y3R7_DREPO|nr:hypothetical protein DPMN_192717 [Dreissena polymorpha]